MYFVFLFQLEHRDVAASQTLRAALSKVEQAHPGFSYDFVLGLVRKADANNVNMNESLLRLQGAVSDQDCKLLRDCVLVTEIGYTHIPQNLQNFQTKKSEENPFSTCLKPIPPTPQK